MILRTKKVRYQVLSGIALVLVICAGGWFFIQKNTAKPAHVAGWETYRNEDLGYEIQYPPDWKTKGYPSYVGKTVYDNALVLFKSPINSDSSGIENQEANHSVLYLGVSSSSETTILKKVFGSTYYDKLIAPSTLRSKIEMTNDNKTYLLVGDSSGPDYAASQAVIDQMLSTFKLLK